MFILLYLKKFLLPSYSVINPMNLCSWNLTQNNRSRNVWSNLQELPIYGEITLIHFVKTLSFSFKRTLGWKPHIQSCSQPPTPCCYSSLAMLLPRQSREMRLCVWYSSEATRLKTVRGGKISPDSLQQIQSKASQQGLVAPAWLMPHLRESTINR